MAFIILFYSKVMRKRESGGGGGSRTPVRESYAVGDYMLSLAKLSCTAFAHQTVQRNASSFNLAIQYTATLNGEFAK